MTRRRLALGAIVTSVAVAVAVGVALARENGAAPVSAPTRSPVTVTFAGVDPVTARRVSLTQFRGKPVVINVWASWCTGCNQEAADLARFSREHPEAQLLGVDVQDTRGGARRFYRRWGWRHPSVFDPRSDLADRLAVQGLPTTIFLDRQHREVGRITGASNFASFTAGLRRAVG